MLDRNHNHFRVWAHGSDITTGASDAGWTVVDGGTIPLALSSNFDYYITQTAIHPETVSDAFHYKVVTLDSNSATPVDKTGELGTHTGAAVAGQDSEKLDWNPPIKVVFSAAASEIGFTIDFGDTDAVAGFMMSGYKVKK